jgi:hypothetical protein
MLISILSIFGEFFVRIRVGVSAYRKGSGVTLDLDLGSIGIRQSHSSIRSSLVRRPADNIPLRNVCYCAPSRLSGLEKEVFGSVTFRLVVFPPPLWHEANEAMSAARMNRAIRLNCFRIPNESRTNAGCKPAKRVSERNQKVAHRSIFGVVCSVWTRT